MHLVSKNLGIEPEALILLDVEPWWNTWRRQLKERRAILDHGFREYSSSCGWKPVLGVPCYLTLIEQEAEKMLGRKRTKVILLGPSLQCPASSSCISPPKVPITSKINTARWPSVETVETHKSEWGLPIFEPWCWAGSLLLSYVLGPSETVHWWLRDIKAGA